MAVILNLTWAIVLFPLVGVGVAFLAESPRRAAQTGVAFTGFAFALALVVLVYRLTHALPAYDNTQTFWDLSTTSASPVDSRLFSSDFLLTWGIRVDPLSVSFMALTLLLSVAAQLHALSSQRGEPGLRRFFWLAGVITFGVLALVSSPNLFQFWLGWEVTAVAAWLLATQHWQRPGIGLHSLRTFAVLRIADLALLLGLVMSFAKFNRAIAAQVVTPGALINDPLSFANLATAWHLGHLGEVAGSGARTLVVLSVLFMLAAVTRSAIGPFHVWLSGALETPAAGLALVGLAALVPAGVLIARVYPLLLEAPGVLTALALVGAAGAAIAAARALAQRDLFRIGMFAVASQGGLVLAAFGMGGFSPALFALLTASCLAVLYFLAAGNLSRAYRTRDVAECGGARRRLPRTTLALVAWAAGISGLSLNSYSVLSATLRNQPPTGGGAAAVVVTGVTAGVLVTMALTSLYAFRVVVLVAGGDPVRRRGFDSGRMREAAPLAGRAVQVALMTAVVATLVGIPGLNTFSIGSRQVPGLTFSHFVFYGAIRQQLAVDFGALVLAAVLGAGGALAARWLFAAGADTAQVNPLRARLARPAVWLAAPTPGERLALLVPAALIRTGEVIADIDTQLLEPIPDAMGESVEAASSWLARLRRPRVAVSTAVAFAVVAVLLAASVLAVTGHFPVRIQ